MYICAVCGKCSEPKQPKLKHIIYRDVLRTNMVNWNPDQYGERPLKEDYTRKEIEREIPVCKECYTDLERGVPMETLLKFEEIKVEQQTDKTPEWVKNADVKKLPRGYEAVKEKFMTLEHVDTGVEIPPYNPYGDSNN